MRRQHFAQTLGCSLVGQFENGGNIGAMHDQNSTVDYAALKEKIRRLQYQKQALVTGVLGEESFASNLALDDVRSLFTRDEEPEPAKKGKSRSSSLLARDP